MNPEQVGDALSERRRHGSERGMPLHKTESLQTGKVLQFGETQCWEGAPGREGMSWPKALQDMKKVSGAEKAPGPRKQDKTKAKDQEGTSCHEHH